MTLSEFKREGIVGCQDCYRYLRVGTEPILRRVQKGLQHTGRRPVGHDAGKLPKPGEGSSPETVPLPGEDPHTAAVKELQRRMKEAVKAEDFELAATLRDELRALQIQKSAGEAKDV